TILPNQFLVSLSERGVRPWWSKIIVRTIAKQITVTLRLVRITTLLGSRSTYVLGLANCGWTIIDIDQLKACNVPMLRITTHRDQLPVIDQTLLEESMKNLRIAFQAWSENIQQKKKEEEKQNTKEQAVKARYWKIPICYDDDEYYTIAITPKEPDNSLSMGDEHLDTILIDSLLDEFVGELILLKSIPPGIDKADCDPKEEIRLIEKLLYDNSSTCPPKEFNSKNSDAIIESFSPSPIPVEVSDPLMKVIDLFLASDGSIPPEFNSKNSDAIIESFSPSPIPVEVSDPLMEVIDLFLASDGSIPPGIDSDYLDSEGDNLFLERLLYDDHIPLPDILDISNVV
nr:hypothetical protein [Tanacetum cinerariifolium]